MFQGRDEKIEIETIPSDDGIFDVALDGKLLYRKFDTGTFPQAGEIADLLRSLL